MSLPAVAGNTLLAADLYQLCQPSGGQEKGKWQVITSCYVNAASVNCFMPSQSRGATPVSVSVDTSGGLNNIGSVSTQNLTASGFSVGGTGVQNTFVQASGNYTIQY